MPPQPRSRSKPNGARTSGRRPVRMYSAIDTNDLEFELVHEKDGGRIGYQKYCKLDEKLVPDDEIVKGYEVSPGQYVTVTDDDGAVFVATLPLDRTAVSP